MSNLKILDTKIIEAPSASGLVNYKNELFVIGDNSPFLFRMNVQGELLSKHLLIEIASNEFGIIDKKQKPDFESMELVNENQLYIFGSGSKSPERDVLIIVYLEEDFRTQYFDLSRYYSQLKSRKEFSAAELNIEATTVFNGFIYFFNRSNNVMFWFLLEDFKAMIFNNEPFIEPKIIQFSLPRIKGIEAGFSGATSLSEQNAMLFTASIENTPNAYDDGEVLGSFIGKIQLNKNNEIESYSAFPLLENDLPLKVKVESVCIHEVLNDSIEVFLVTDNDGEASELIRCSFLLD